MINDNFEFLLYGAEPAPSKIYNESDTQLYTLTKDLKI